LGSTHRDASQFRFNAEMAAGLPKVSSAGDEQWQIAPTDTHHVAVLYF
jgi:hypothetical protein